VCSNDRIIPSAVLFISRGSEVVGSEVADTPDYDFGTQGTQAEFRAWSMPLETLNPPVRARAEEPALVAAARSLR